MKVSRELAQGHRAWSMSVRDVVNSIGDAGSARPGWMPTSVKESLNPKFSSILPHLLAISIAAFL